MHRTSGRWRLGLTLALTTAAFWGVLPIALTITLHDMDVYTITWYRFAVSALVLGLVLAATGRLPAVRTLAGHEVRLLAVALFGLVGNYILFLFALTVTTPSVVQVVGQISPMLLLLGGLLVFRERFSGWQWVGFAALITGLLLFFNRRLPELANVHAGLGLGVTIIVSAALVWTFYGLAQKQLLKHLESQQILWLLYLGATVVLVPLSHFGQLAALSGLELGMLAFCCANTLIAYGAFAEALEHWEVSRVGAVLALAPLFTLASMWLAERIFPEYVKPESLNALSITGALLVVSGSALCALAQRPSAEETT